MANLAFLKDFRKKIDKMDNVTTDFGPPTHWYSTGALAVNKILSGSFKNGIPQGRVTVFAGPSGSGKSFLACNVIANAQKDGAFVLALDSENALDDKFVSMIGVDVSPENYLHLGVVTIQDVTSIMSDFITGYEKEHGRNNPNSPKVVILLDSIDMLLTDAENENFDKGEQKGDMGQRTKQIKHLLRTVVSRIGRLNISFLATHQVYSNQDIKNGEGVWIVNNSIKYSASQIALITKLKLKEETEVVGIKMRVETYKSRFAKLGSKVEIEVPYERGMDPYSGLLEMFVDEGAITQGGAWYSLDLPGKETRKFQRKNLDAELIDLILSHPKLDKAEKLVVVDESPINVTPDLVTDLSNPEAE